MQIRQNMKNNIKVNRPALVWFCLTILIALGLLCVCLGYTSCVLKESQEKIINVHTKHVAKVDSIFCDMKKIILCKDSGTIANAPVLLSQLQRDSALFRREILLSQEEMNCLTELHLNKIDSNYDQIGIWFGVASVIFLVIGFFSMFKIEESKKDAQDILKDVKQKSNEALKNVEMVQNQAAEVANYSESIKQAYNKFVDEWASKLDELESHLSASLSDSNNTLETIKTLLKEVENENEQYKWSNDMMQKQMQQMESLMDKLNEVLMKAEKEVNNEQ